MNPNDLTPTQQVARLKGTDHTEQLYKLAMEQAEELERVQKSYVLQRESHEVEIYAWGQRNAELSRQVEELKELCKDSPMQLIEQARKLRAENAELRKDKERLDWLEKHNVSMNQLYWNRDSVKRFWHLFWDCNGGPTKHFGGEETALLDLRTAIDQAMKGAK